MHDKVDGERTSRLLSVQSPLSLLLVHADYEQLSRVSVTCLSIFFAESSTDRETLLGANLFVVCVCLQQGMSFITLTLLSEVLGLQL